MKIYYKPFFFFLFSCSAFIYADEAAALLQKETNEATVVLQKAKRSEPYCETVTETYSWDQDLNDETCICVQEEREPMFLAVDWVYFKAVEDSLRYAIRFPSADLIETMDADSTCFEQKPSYRSGVRVRGALPSTCGRWRIAGSWLNFNSSPPQIHAKNPDFGLVANYAVPNFGVINTSGTTAVTGKWKLYVNEFDLVLQKHLYLDSKITLNPYAGVKGGIIRQFVHVRYGDILPGGLGSLPAPQSFQAKSSYWGVGPVLGIAMNYPLCQSLHVFFDGSLAGVVGDFKVRSTYKEFIENPSLEWQIKNMKTSLSVATQWRAGVQFSREINRFLLQLEAGWEAHHWSGQMRIDSMATFIFPQNSGSDLSFYGPFVRMLLAF